ncbi:MAG: 2,3-diphosphoglycerate-dependent phosphoglycerate mutase [Bacteroidales bacterium]|jgi:2,3-bisphosphoglycerate-dependent phosphoglycerate mutase|nr:2,3-diphosphoglycerate-dependent phosphoglycerate mutase [Bacteroidales bacterium]MBQ9436684.1 2,3-diphosphoglycerate-dependent phosphoglycerate mutase [Bacteroidales bacterium]
MYRLVLIRHGESTWNKENRFTGWTDVDLSERGVNEAKQAGQKLLEAGFQFKYAYTSFLKRAIKTLNYVLEEMNLLWIPVEKTWRLNEKHYGMLQGLNKTEMVEKYGEQQVLIWRRSYDVRPPKLEESDPRHPINDVRYAGINEKGCAPATEALIDTVERIVPFWKSDISKKLQEHKEVIVAAHGNSLRGIVKYLKNISDADIVSLNLPTGIPYVFEFDENMNLVKDYFLADEATLKKLMEEVANQGKKK